VSKIMNIASVFCLWFLALVIGCMLSIIFTATVAIVHQIADYDLRNLASFIMGMGWLALLRRLGEKK
jgi:hypothetical protein